MATANAMKIGMSLYSLSRAIRAGELDCLEAIEWIADHGAEHVEIVPGNYLDLHDAKMLKAVKAKAKKCKIALSSYTIGANFVTAGEDGHEIKKTEYRKEIERVKGEVDIAKALGVKLMRHDVGYRPADKCTLEQFEIDLPKVADACREIADYAAGFGITTSVENHGFHFQGSERVRRLVKAVDRPNYKTTIDVGNFLCADEQPISGLKNNIDIATGIIHFKDFHIRDWVPTTAMHFKTLHGRYLRGAMTGFGDVNLREVVAFLKEVKYKGFISVEYEGKEPCLEGAEVSLANVKALFA